ncbi:Cyclic di-GMP phosphodiesterase response regulator RpfG [Azospirillaceae bacterium]
MYNVMIVDDNPTTLLVLKRLVAVSGPIVPIPFSSAIQAFDFCCASPPDIILADYMMPEIDGLEFLRRLRNESSLSDIPVIMVMTADKKEIRYKALDMGACDFLTKPVDPPELTARVRNVLALADGRKQLKSRAATELVMRLSKAAEFRDPETGAHLERMARYSRLIARRLGWSEEDQEQLQVAAPMHDIGKVGIPDYILLKPGKLTDDEFAIMKEHATLGYEILKDSDSPLIRLAAQIARCHHEKYDGSGYPNGVGGEEIPIPGRIVAVADVYDALTSERPYKKAWPIEKAVGLLKEQRGVHFEPRLVDLFLESFDEVLVIGREFQERSIII